MFLNWYKFNSRGYPADHRVVMGLQSEFKGIMHRETKPDFVSLDREDIKQLQAMDAKALRLKLTQLIATLKE